MVRERAGFTRYDCIEAFRSGLQRQGWDADAVEELAEALLDEVAHRPAGAVVEHRLGDIRQRG